MLGELWANKYHPHLTIERQAKKRCPDLKRDANNFFAMSELEFEVQRFDTISFDFFDTVASRECALHEVYQKTAEFGENTIHGDNGIIPKTVFLAARGKIANSVKQSTIEAENRNEIHITELFERALRPHIADASRRQHEAHRLVEFETRFEISQLRVDPQFLELVEIIRQLNKRIILITDMYLPADSIDSILNNLGLGDTFDHVFVSATVGVTKNSGLLFDHVAKTLKAKPQTFLHVGDNFINDFQQPRARGWNAMHFFHSGNQLAMHKADLKQHFTKTSPKFRAQKIDKLLDNNNHCSAALTPELAELINTVIAPAFAVFTAKMLTSAKRNNLQRLYFLTRDGTLFRSIAEIINDRLGYLDTDRTQISTLAISRSSAILLQYENLYHLGWAQHSVEWMSNKPLTLRKLMGCFHITTKDLPKLSVSDLEFLETNLDVEGFQPVTDVLMANTELRHRLENLFAFRKQLTVDYLKQEGVLDAQKIGLIDIGYSGTIIKFLSEYLFKKEHMDQFSKLQMQCYFFASNRFFVGNVDQMHPGVVMNPGLIVDHNEDGDKPLVMNFGWLEPFSLEPNLGRLQYFRKVDDRIEPVFAEPRQTEVRQQVRDALLQRSEELAGDILASTVSFEDLEKGVRGRLRKFVSNPTKRQVKAMETLMHDFGIADSQDNSVVKRIPITQMPPNLNKLMRNDNWLQGSLKKSGLGIFNPIVNKWSRTIR